MMIVAPTTMRALTFTGAAGEQTLLSRLRAGETAALGEVYDLHHEAVRAFAVRLVGDGAAAEDLVHDVFVALPKAVRRFRGGGALRSFLIGIAINRARHHVRSAARRRALAERAQREASEPMASTPEETAGRRAFLAALHRALDDLPLDQRIAFVLCDVEEKTSVEAAAITGRSEATMRTRLHHARRKLRRALEREGYR